MLKKYAYCGHFGWKTGFLKTSAHIDNIHCHDRPPADLLLAFYNLYQNVDTSFLLQYLMQKDDVDIWQIS